MVHSTDVVIIGAGPVGLFQVFELGLQGISSHIIDALPQPGGQCTELYPDKPIYDIPAVPVCTGQELTENLLKQIAPFEPVMHLEQEVVVMEKQADDSFYLKTGKGEEFTCRAVVIAAGGGSFTPVKLRVEGIEKFIDEQVFYRVREPARHKDKDLIILGGGDSALDWALALYSEARSLTVINRTERFRAAEASVSKLEELSSDERIAIKLGVATAFREHNSQLTELEITLRDEARTKIWLPVDHLLIFFGMSPKIGEIENWGVDLERKHITIDSTTYQTSLPGVYAVGDISTYPGKKKLILSGFHEAALAAYAIKHQFEPDKKVSVQYTTTSPLMHNRLGV